MQVSHCQIEIPREASVGAAEISPVSGAACSRTCASMSGAGNSGVSIAASGAAAVTCARRSGSTAYSRVCVSVFHQGREISGRVYSPGRAGMMAFFCCLTPVIPSAVLRFSSSGWSGYCLKPSGSSSCISGNWLAVRPRAVSVRVRVTGSLGNSSRGFFDHFPVISTSTAGNQCPDG